MSLPPAPAPFTDADYELIATAVLETARGRWFLSEHARRNRHADTRLVLQAIERLEHSIAQRANAIEADRMHLNLIDMMKAIARTKAEIAVLKPAGETGGKIEDASSELDAIVGTTEKATSDILAAAERIQEIAWTMREQGIDASICDLIDAHTTEVYTACSFQDLTGQRIRKVINVMRFLEARIDAMIKIWRLDDIEMVAVDVTDAAPSLTNGPAMPGEGLQQQAIDALLADQGTEDVFWCDSEKNGSHDSRNLGDFDLDDLEVLQPARDQKPAPAASDGRARIPATAPLASPPGPRAGKPADSMAAREEGVQSLTPAERQALFS
jgi:chemotaxis regulatin CheY-phosphate phosphatase CheZ